MKHLVNNTSDALLYITDCTLATVAYMGSLKSKNKSDYNRQIEIAQSAINWIIQFNVSNIKSRPFDVISKFNGSVKAWALSKEN